MCAYGSSSCDSTATAVVADAVTAAVADAASPADNNDCGDGM